MWEEDVTMMVVDSHGVPVAFMADRPDVVKNRRLIAAAPDLLRVAKQLLQLAEDAYLVKTEDGSEIAHPYIIEARDLIKRIER